MTTDSTGSGELPKLKDEEAKEVKRLKIEENKSEPEKFAKETEKIKAENEKAGIAAPVCDFCGKRSCSGHSRSKWDANTNFWQNDIKENDFVIVPYLDKAGLSKLSQATIFMRKEVCRLFKKLDRFFYIEISGSPGVGKSMTVWVWALIQTRRSKKRVRWIHYERLQATRIMDFDGEGYMSAVCPIINNSIILECKGIDILIIDGISGETEHERYLGSCVAGMTYPCRVIMVLSEHLKERKTGSFEELYMCGWSMSEYRSACSNKEFWEEVEDNVTCPITNELIYSDEEDPKESLLKNKYFYAGSSARFFFYMTVDKVKIRINKALQRVSNECSLFFLHASLSPGTTISVNTVLASKENDDGSLETSLVSEYVFWKVRKNHSQEVSEFEAEFVSEFDNRSFLGMYYEHVFLRLLRDGEVAILTGVDDSSIQWKFGLSIVLLDEFITGMGLSDPFIYLSWMFDKARTCPSNCRDFEYKNLSSLKSHMRSKHGWNFSIFAESKWGDDSSEFYFKPEEDEVEKIRSEQVRRVGNFSVGKWLIPARFNYQGYDCIFRESKTTLVLVQITISATHGMKLGDFVKMVRFVKENTQR